MIQLRNLRSVFRQLAVFVPVLLGAPTIMQAQFGWEYIYGNTNTYERGNDVHWATSGCWECDNCAIGDVIAVGLTEDPVTQNSKDVYVVRTGSSGTAVWEQTIDIGSLGLDDVALAVEDDPATGDIVIVGSTEAPLNPPFTQDNAFLLRIHCDGSYSLNVIHAHAFFPSDMSDDVYYDVEIVTPGSYGQPCDYIVAGSSEHWNDGTIDAIIARIDYFGGIIWGSRYQSGGGSGAADEVFYSVDVLPNGDIVAGGYERRSNENNGYAVRVNGANGSLVGPNRGSGVWGRGNRLDDEIHSIIGLLNPAENGAVAMTGLTQGNKMLLARVNGGNFGFGMLAGVEYGITFTNPGLIPAYGVGNEIIEVQSPFTGGSVQPYDLAITGKGTYFAGTANSDYDAFLFTYRNPFAGPPPAPIIVNRFGGLSHEEGNSIVETPVGFLITGYTRSDFLNVNDVEDLYLLSTTANGNTGCDNLSNGVAQSLFLRESIQSQALSWGVMSGRTPTQTPVEWSNLICDFPKRVQFGIEGQEGESSVLLSGTSVESVPVQLFHTSGMPLMIPNGGSVADVVVYSLAGETVAQFSSEEKEIAIETSNWPTGLYLIQVRVGEDVERYRVQIAE